MEEGITEYNSLTTAIDYICCFVRVLYAATSEKARTLEHIMDSRRSVISLELLGCPPLTMMNGKHQCLLHHIYAPKFYCTLDSVTNLANWCSENSQLVNLHLPHVRVKTFRDWKCTTPSPKELADQGFIHCAVEGDSTKCVYCGVQLFRWEEGDDVAKDHEYNSPVCKFIQSLHLKREEERRKNIQSRRINGDFTADSAHSESFHTTVCDCSASMCVQPSTPYEFEITNSDLEDACRS